VSSRLTNDKSSTARGARLAARIKEAGGATVKVRFPTAAALQQLDDLVDAGVGTSRNDVLQALVAEKCTTLADATQNQEQDQP
jgi:hypothetical protein